MLICKWIYSNTWWQIMKNPAENNKRVAKNTLFLYFRMILIMLVTLYTSRGVLAELGIDDYGIYNVVGGVVLMFSFLNSCMSTATQRFPYIRAWSRWYGQIKKCVCCSIKPPYSYGILIIFLAETIGLWFVNESWSFLITGLLQPIGSISFPYWLFASTSFRCRIMQS